MLELPAQLPSSLQHQRLDDLLDWTCEVPDTVMAALEYPGVGQPNAMDLDVALKAQQGAHGPASNHAEVEVAAAAVVDRQEDGTVTCIALLARPCCQAAHYKAGCLCVLEQA